MTFHRARNLLFCSADERDLDYVQAVAEQVLAHHSEELPRSRSGETSCQWRIVSSMRAAIIGVQRNDRVCCVKLFHDKRLRTRLRVALRLAKGRRAYRYGVRLRAAGVDCPAMIGYAEQRPFGPAMVITELIEDGLRVDHWVKKRGLERQAVLALARTIRAMHDHGVYHLDLSHRNILVRQRGTEYGFLLLDYEDARFVAEVSQRIRLKNLHHLHERIADFVSVRDRLRFLRLYAGDDYRLYRDILHKRIRTSTWSKHHRPLKRGPS